MKNKYKNKNGVDIISEERSRQIIEERFTYENDDKYEGESLAICGAIYAMPAKLRDYWSDTELPMNWVWDAEWWKPTPEDRVRELAKAGALIAAEIDRLLRVKD